MEKETILGFDVCTCNKQNLLENIFKDYKAGNQLFIVNINPEIVTSNYKNEIYKKALNSEKYQIPDGTGIVWASRRNKGNIKTRITGIDLMLDICKTAQEYPAKIYLYGSKKEIVTQAKQNLEKEYPKINIVGICDGYCSEDSAIKDIKETKADIVFVGLGSPKQENFIINNKGKLKNVKIFMPVGGSFDVISKSKKRAPNWIMKCNLEWLYRLLQEPKRIGRQMKLVKFMPLIKGEKDEKN